MDYERTPLNDAKSSKYELDDSTFDMIDVNDFTNTRSKTIFWYITAWILLVLSWVLLGSDIYTCLNILVFHNWDSSANLIGYKPYAYNVAKWIFMSCIIFQFVLLFYHWIWAIKAYRSRKIALIYLNPIARLIYTVRSYSYFCVFNEIDQDNFFDWSCFYILDELDGALQILLSDTPRQVINILTLKYYATDGSNDVLENIQNIYTHNPRLGIILSFVLLSLVIWSFFIFRFGLAILLYPPISFKLRREKGYKSLKKYCCQLVNKLVRASVFKHKSDLKNFTFFPRNDSVLSDSIQLHSDNKKNPYKLNDISMSTLQSIDDLPAPEDVMKYPTYHKNDSKSSLLYSHPRNSSFPQTYDPNQLRKPSVPSKDLATAIGASRGGQFDSFQNPFSDKFSTEYRGLLNHKTDNPFDDKYDDRGIRRVQGENPFSDFEYKPNPHRSSSLPLSQLGSDPDTHHLSNHPKTVQKSSTFDEGVARENGSNGFPVSTNFISRTGNDSSGNMAQYERAKMHKNPPKRKPYIDVQDAFVRGEPQGQKMLGNGFSSSLVMQDYDPNATYDSPKELQNEYRSQLAIPGSRSEMQLNNPDWIPATDDTSTSETSVPYPTRNISAYELYDYDRDVRTFGNNTTSK
jgi:hypothetical protein